MWRGEVFAISDCLVTNVFNMVFPRHAFINNDTKEFGILYTDYILTIDGNFAIFMITLLRGPAIIM